jgi:Fe-S oxidoreductase
MVPGLEVRTVQSSCCGMAGSFGYEAEHYEVSMRMGELSLLPEARKAGDALLVADGTSCRQQIAHGAGRDAWHVARVLESALSAPRTAPSPATP